MHLTLSRKIIFILLTVSLLLSVAACQKKESYLVRDYLLELSNASGINLSDKLDDCAQSLIAFKVIDEIDLNKANENLTFKVINDSLLKLMQVEDKDYFIKNRLINKNIKENDCIDKEKAYSLIEYAVDKINHPSFENKTNYTFAENVVDIGKAVDDIYYDESKDAYFKLVQDEDEIKSIPAQMDEVFANLDINESYEIDFDEAEIIPYNQEDLTSYKNNNFELLSDKNHAFYKDGFRVSYTILNSGISVHVSKRLKSQTVFADLSIKNVKPTIRFSSEDEGIKNVFFSLSFNSTEQFGTTNGRYKNYHLDFKDSDPTSLKNYLQSIIKQNKEDVEATFKICTIKTKIPNVPTAYLNLDLLLNLYTNGEVELLLTNYHQLGFEIKDGNLRIINDYKHNVDGIIGANAKASVGINMNLEAIKTKLCDIELDTGTKASIKTTLHLYDDELKSSTLQSDIAYSVCNDITSNSNNIRVCGDVSLSWLLDLKLNTANTKLYDYGFNRVFHLMDDDNQIFHNLHHIEDGMFVKKCTRESKRYKKDTFDVTSNKISLSTYAEVITVNKTKQFNILTIPQGYTKDDIEVVSNNIDVAIVKDDTIIALKPGNTQILVKTKDSKYIAYINVLVSTG